MHESTSQCASLPMAVGPHFSFFHTSPMMVSFRLNLQIGNFALNQNDVMRRIRLKLDVFRARFHRILWPQKEASQCAKGQVLLQLGLPRTRARHLAISLQQHTCVPPNTGTTTNSRGPCCTISRSSDCSSAAIHFEKSLANPLDPNSSDSAGFL